MHRRLHILKSAPYRTMICTFFQMRTFPSYHCVERWTVRIFICFDFFLQLSKHFFIIPGKCSPNPEFNIIMKTVIYYFRRLCGTSLHLSFMPWTIPSQKGQKFMLLPQILKLICRFKIPLKNILIQRNLLAEEHGKIHHMSRPGASEEICHSLSIFHSTSLPGNSGHNMRIVNQTSSM